MADLSLELYQLLRKSRSETRESLASARDSIEAARRAMDEADAVIAGDRILAPVSPMRAAEPR